MQARFIVEAKDGSRVGQLTRFATSKHRGLVRAALDFRNFYSVSNPKLCRELTHHSDQARVCPLSAPAWPPTPEASRQRRSHEAAKASDRAVLLAQIWRPSQVANVHSSLAHWPASLPDLSAANPESSLCCFKVNDNGGVSVTSVGGMATLTLSPHAKFFSVIFAAKASFRFQEPPEAQSRSRSLVQHQPQE